MHSLESAKVGSQVYAVSPVWAIIIVFMIISLNDAAWDPNLWQKVHPHVVVHNVKKITYNSTYIDLL